MARAVPYLAPFLQVSTRAADAMRAMLGTFSTRAYHHANDQSRALEIGRFMNQPELGHWTYATIGLANTTWSELGRPRVELLLASTVVSEAEHVMWRSDARGFEDHLTRRDIDVMDLRPGIVLKITNFMLIDRRSRENRRARWPAGLSGRPAV